MAQRKVKLDGKRSVALKLLPLTQPLFAGYIRPCKDTGRDDLLVGLTRAPTTTESPMFAPDMTDEEFEPIFAKAAGTLDSSSVRSARSTTSRTLSPTRRSRRSRTAVSARCRCRRSTAASGGDLLQTSKVVSELSRGDSAITLAYNMHYIMVGIAGSLMSDTQNKYWLGRVADGDIMFGPFSEQRAGFSGLADMKAVPQPDGGWKVYGKKTWGTLCEAADHHHHQRDHHRRRRQPAGGLPGARQRRELLHRRLRRRRERPGRRHPDREDLGRSRHARHRHPDDPLRRLLRP